MIQDYLKKHLTPRPFIYDKANPFLYFNHSDNKVRWCIDTYMSTIGAIYFNSDIPFDDIVNFLNDNKVSWNELVKLTECFKEDK